MSEEQTEKLPEKLEGGEWTRPLFTEEQERIGPPVWWEITTPTDGCTFHTYGYAATQELSVLFAAAPRMLKALQSCLWLLENHLEEPSKPWIVDILHENLKEECRLAIAAAEGREDVKTAKEMLLATIAKAKEVVEEIDREKNAKARTAVQKPVRIGDVPLQGNVELAAGDNVQLSAPVWLGGTWINVSALSGVQPEGPV